MKNEGEFYSLIDQSTLAIIKEAIQKGAFRFSDHAVKRMIKRSIRRKEIEEVVLSLPPQIVVITVYEPDAAEWIEGRIRRKP